MYIYCSTAKTVSIINVTITWHCLAVLSRYVSVFHFITLLYCLAVQQPNLSHPFHLHGYAFHVIGMGRSPDRNVKKINLKHALDLDRRGLLNREFNLPPGKDTIAVPNNGYVVFRFRADNPGESTDFFKSCHDSLRHKCSLSLFWISQGVSTFLTCKSIRKTEFTTQTCQF